jgi:transcriptional regulator with XRE-family HTH domain
VVTKAPQRLVTEETNNVSADAQTLEAHRRARGDTIVAFAAFLGITTRTYRWLLHDNGRVQERTKVRVARRLGVERTQVIELAPSTPSTSESES